LHVALSNNEAVVVVDGRSEAAFAQEHIPGAINLPHRGICTLSTEALDKSKTYICYCDGIGCNGSTKTALKLLTLGFKVRELIGGLDWWKRDGYQTAGLEGRAGMPVGCGC
jgi:rhodanese-related sulfurtransferase